MMKQKYILDMPLEEYIQDLEDRIEQFKEDYYNEEDEETDFGDAQVLVCTSSNQKPNMAILCEYTIVDKKRLEEVKKELLETGEITK